MKKQPDDIARGEQAADRAVCSIKHLRVGVDLQSAEGERDAAGNGIGPVGRLVDGIGPVGFFWRDSLGAAPVHFSCVESDIFAHRIVEFSNRVI